MAAEDVPGRLEQAFSTKKAKFPTDNRSELAIQRLSYQPIVPKVLRGEWGHPRPHEAQIGRLVGRSLRVWARRPGSRTACGQAEGER